MDYKKVAVLIITVFLCIPSFALALDLPFLSPEKPDLKKNKGQFMLVQAGPDIGDGATFVIKDARFNDVGAISFKSLKGAVFFNNKTLSEKPVEFSFAGVEQASEWLDSVFPGFICLTAYGLQECKR